MQFAISKLLMVQAFKDNNITESNLNGANGGYIPHD